MQRKSRLWLVGCKYFVWPIKISVLQSFPIKVCPLSSCRIASYFILCNRITFFGEKADCFWRTNWLLVKRTRRKKTAERGNFRTEIANKVGDWRWQWRKYSCSRGIKYLPFSNFDLDKKKCAWYNLLRMRLTVSATLVVTQCQNVCV